jgi:Bromodomain
MADALAQLLEADAHFCSPFSYPVTEAIAPGYTEEVPLPMHLYLVLDRLQQLYYRRAAAVTADLQLIASNCALYNGADSDITQQAHKVVAAAVAAVESCYNGGSGSSGSGRKKGNSNAKRR